MTGHLIELVKKGDEFAAEQLCRVYGERVRRVLRLRCSSEIRLKTESWEEMEDAMIWAVRSLGRYKYENEPKFVRWLCRAAEERLKNPSAGQQDSKGNLEAGIIDIDVKSLQESLASGDAPVGAAANALISRGVEFDRLETAFDQLKPEYKEAIIMSKIDGLGYKAVGDRFGSGGEAARKLLAYAIARLSQNLEAIS
jgi:RNA polymerase sigma factor (sigma-70 family)